MTHWVAMNVHRGGGKTVFCTMRLIQAALTTKTKNGIPAKFSYVGMSISHARQTIWNELKHYLAPLGDKVQFNSNDNTVTFENGNIILLSGYEDPERNRGLHLHGLVLDEAQGCPQKVWDEILMATLAQNEAWLIVIGTPRGTGNLFHKFCLQGDDPNDDTITTITRTVADTGEMSPTMWKRILANGDRDAIRQEYFCDFMARVKNRVYSNFDTRTSFPAGDDTKPHIDPSIRFDKDRPVWVGMDFNVGTLPAVCAQMQDDGTIHIFNELTLHDTTTDRMAALLRAEFPNQNVIICPDASGTQRKTSALAGSDITILKRMGFEVRIPTMNPRTKHRVLACQVALESADGTRSVFIHPRCKRLIECLTLQQYNANGDPDKTKGFDHHADAFGYLICALRPIKYNRTRSREFIL